MNNMDAVKRCVLEMIKTKNGKDVNTSGSGKNVGIMQHGQSTAYTITHNSKCNADVGDAPTKAKKAPNRVCNAKH